MDRDRIAPHSALRQLQCLEARFRRPHRRAVVLALACVLVPSALLLPIPLLQALNKRVPRLWEASRHEKT